MDVSEIQGPGVTPQLIEQLQAWGISFLTNIQVLALEKGVADGTSMIISAPTSSGKTLVGEIAVLRALQAHSRAIYLVSHKALADQKYKDFRERFGEDADKPLATVGLDTGDRTEGERNAQLVVATYEKALGLFISGQLDAKDALVVADELQIIGEAGRGPNIEVLCSTLRQRGMRQFVALTATVENADDIAGWMECQLVQSAQRDVPLLQEIWYRGQASRTQFGDDAAQEIVGIAGQSSNVLDVVDRLLELERGPILVFTESRREAANMAVAYGQRRPRWAEGIAIGEQLELFSEPTESSDQLRANAERRVAFHSADLSPQERQVIEGGFTDRKFDVCFATSTLAAGVNFPFRSIVFWKLTYQWGGRAGTMLKRSDYRNMSGRAGRLGMYDDGFSIILPRNGVELSHANALVLAENDSFESQLFNLSLRKTLLMLVASGIVSNFTEVMEFFKNSLYWYQTLHRNPQKLSDLERKSRAATEWLTEHEMLSSDEDGSLRISPIGHATASTGLLPSTAANFIQILDAIREALAQGDDDWAPGLIYAACTCNEFHADRPSRFLPFPGGRSYDSVTYWGPKALPVDLDRTDLQSAQCAHAIALYIEGAAERQIAYITNVSSGQVHRLSLDVAWILDGLHRLSTVPDLGIPQTSSNKLAMLSRRVRHGAPVEALDMLRLAERHGVPGLGRQRVMGLLAQGITSIHDILDTEKSKLADLLSSEQRATALLEAASNMAGIDPSRLNSVHLQVGQALGLQAIIAACNDKLGTEYEQAIVDLLRNEARWTVKVIDDGKKQNVPDLLIEVPEIKILLECKTCTKSPPLIKKEEAWAVLQKAADYDGDMRRVTLGKPAFDETSKGKASAAHDITLVEHAVFTEGVLRVLSGSLEPTEFLRWLGEPGVAELERLPGTPTYKK